MKTPFNLIFDNAGGITLQTDDYVHHFLGREQELAQFVSELMEGGSTDHWNGHDPKARLVYDYMEESYGGCDWDAHGDVADYLRVSVRDSGGVLDDMGGYAKRKFYQSLYRLYVDKVASD